MRVIAFSPRRAVDRSERRPGRQPRGGNPVLPGEHRAQVRLDAVWDHDAAPHQAHGQPFFDDREIRHVQGDELGGTQSGGVSDEQHGAIAHPHQAEGYRGEQRCELGGVERHRVRRCPPLVPLGTRERDADAFVVGRSREPRRPVPVTDRGNTPGHRCRVVARFERLDVVDDGRGCGRHHGLTARDAPAREVGPITPGRVQA
jgi:hypothetical protein